MRVISVLVLVKWRSVSARIFFELATALDSISEAEDGQGERQPQREEMDPTSTAALSRTNGMRPVEIARKWSECRKEAEKLDTEAEAAS